jgi:hypothetical protein
LGYVSTSRQSHHCEKALLMIESCLFEVARTASTDLLLRVCVADGRMTRISPSSPGLWQDLEQTSRDSRLFRLGACFHHRSILQVTYAIATDQHWAHANTLGRPHGLQPVTLGSIIVSWPLQKGVGLKEARSSIQSGRPFHQHTALPRTQASGPEHPHGGSRGTSSMA